MRLVEPDSGPLQYTKPKGDPPPIFHAVYRQEQAQTYGPRPVLHPGQTDCKEAIDVVTIIRMYVLLGTMAGGRVRRRAAGCPTEEKPPWRSAWNMKTRREEVERKRPGAGEVVRPDRR